MASATEIINRLRSYVQDSPDIASWDAEHIRSELAALVEALSPDEPETAVPGLTLQTIRDDIRARKPDARFALFGTDEWENGFFFVLTSAEVVTEDGQAETLEDLNLHSWEGELTDEFGPVGRDSMLIVDLESLQTFDAATYTATDTLNTLLPEGVSVWVAEEPDPPTFESQVETVMTGAMSAEEKLARIADLLPRTS